jgi:hypothetical protein
VNAQLWLYCLALSLLILGVMVVVVLDGRRRP